MLFDLANILVFLVIAVVFLAVTLLFGRFLRPDAQNATKGDAYECGERPVGSSWFNFNPRFYVVALVFLIFDVEVAFTYPVAAAFRRYLAAGDGALAFVEIAVFVLILAVGLAYVWRRGDLDWARPAEAERDR